MTEGITRDDMVTRPGGGVLKHLFAPMPVERAALEPHIETGAQTICMAGGRP